MKSKIKLVALVTSVSAMLFLSSCSWDKTYLYSNGGDGIKDSICFQNEIFPIINSNCAKSGCHDAITMEKGYNFSTYSGIMEAVMPGNLEDSKLYEVLNEEGEDRMPPPPSDPLLAEQIDLIGQWIIEGAGYNVDCGTYVQCDTINVTYSVTISGIMSTNCLGCHSNGGTGGGILLTTWAQVSDQVNNGRLLCAVNWTGCSNMPKNSVKLSSCDLLKIQIWANAGTPNN
ncbi:MAG: hypothetical protein LH473_03330 [Chitinophagales bacterium]|nr:hypothetical protein [Chitinophagales bacterium]